MVDTDMDFDDAAALAYPSQEHKKGRIQLRAVTVTNSGAGLARVAIRNARCLLRRFGLSHVPVADGSPTAVHLAGHPRLCGRPRLLVDPLAAMAATTPGVVSYQAERIAVVQDGAQSGRTAPSADGPGVQVGVHSDQIRFEQVFLDTLNGRT